MKNKRSVISASIAAIIILLGSLLVSCAPPTWGPHWGPSAWAPFWGFPVGLFGLAFYFTPTIVAAFRRHPSLLPIVLVNFFAGWTVIGWIITFIWALSGPSRK